MGRSPYRIFQQRLPNGLRAFTIEMPHLHTATVALYVRVGSRHERAHESGLSHFVEHMLFRGCRGYPTSLKLNSALEAEGGGLYAETGRGYTLYQSSPRPSGVPRVLEILGALFRAPLFSDIEAERQMIIEEILEDRDERGRVASLPELARKKVWNGHPLGFPITGPLHNVRRFTRKDLVRHFRRYYGARNLVLCVGGKVWHRQLAGVIRRAFSALPPGRRTRLVPVRPFRDGPRITCAQSDSAQAQLHMLFFAPGADDARAAATSALLRLIDDGFSTPLHYRICDQKGLAYQVSADLEIFHDVSLFEIDAACSPGKLPALVSEVLAILDEFARGAADVPALDRVKAHYVEDFEAGYDDVLGLCGLVGGSALFSARMIKPLERLRRVQCVTVQEVQKVAAQIFHRRGLTVAIGGKFERAHVAAVRRQLARFGDRDTQYR